jgi:hypothetical protein
MAFLLAVALLSPSLRACEPLTEVPEAAQVAWVSKLNAAAGNDTWLEVVELGKLREMVTRNARDSTRVLRGLGLLRRTQPQRAEYKVTVFEVARSQLCREMEGEPGAEVAGVQVCASSEQRQGAGVKAAAYTGCGYHTDQSAGVRGLDVFRLRWADAVSKGFCVLPWTRLLAEG